MMDMMETHGDAIARTAFFNMLHPFPEIRSRAFTTMARLIPPRFGIRREEFEDSSAQLLREAVKKYQSIFTAQVVEVAKENALSMASIAAKSCSHFTEGLFREAFSRIGRIPSEPSKRWMLEYLLPWADNVFLDRKNLADFTPETFLDHVLQHFTVELAQNDMVLPREMIRFWQRLSHAYVIVISTCSS